jgi:hypothetical protein
MSATISTISILGRVRPAKRRKLVESHLHRFGPVLELGSILDWIRRPLVLGRLLRPGCARPPSPPRSCSGLARCWSGM